jgi:hypothetical protein
MKPLLLTATNCLNQAKVQLRKTRVTLFGCVAGLAVVVPLIGTGCLSLRAPSPTELSGSAQLATAPPGLSEPVTLRVLTMNVWGLKFLSDHRAERMPAIGARLAQLEPDLIGLQEATAGNGRPVPCFPPPRAPEPY